MKEIRVPDFLTKKDKILKFLISVAVFAFFFILIYKPFGSMKWLDNMNFDTYFIYTGVIVFSGFLVLSFSRFLLYKIQKLRRLELKHYLCWLVVEILIIAVACALVGIAINKNHSMTFWELIPRVFLYSLSILSIPYIVFGLYFALIEKNRQLQEYLNEKMKVNENLSSEDLVKFYDKGGNVRLTVKFEYLFYIESFGNYVKVFYLNHDKINRFLLRNTLQNIEQQFEKTQLVRCHRSMIVNITKIKLVRKEKENYWIELDNPNTPIIPISKSYYLQFIQMIK